MPEHFTRCKQDASDYLSVYRDDDGDIAIRGYSCDTRVVTIYPTDNNARELAHALLALVGDPAPSTAAPIQVGDRVRVVKTEPGRGSSHDGRTATVKELDDGDASYPYLVSVESREYDVWVHHVERLADEVKPAPDVPIRVGDRVTVTRSAMGDEGRNGTVDRVDANDDMVPYRVKLDGNEYSVWVRGVRRVADVATPAPSSSPVDLLRQAQSLLAGTTHTGSDVVAMARFLGGVA